jgi:hypothetical protein
MSEWNIPILEGEQITLKSGATVAWITFDACCHSQLDVCKWPEGPLEGCRNPWVFVEDGDERKLVKAKQPAVQPVPGNHQSALVLEYMNAATIQDELQSYIASDCWAVYVADKNRLLGVRQVYFDSRASDDVLEQERRDGICMTELCAHLNEDHTVVLVMGGNEFMEIYFSRVPSSSDRPVGPALPQSDLYMIATVAHRTRSVYP